MLILSTLGFSSAWAFDSHVLEQIDVASDSLSDSLGTASDDSRGGIPADDHNKIDVACDHCCHISSHLVAIFSDSGCATTVSVATHTTSLTEGLHSFIPEPNRKPPRL